MSRLITCVALILCCFIMSGCRVCSSPYLHCGPVDDMGGNGCGSCGGASCDPLYRSASVLNGYHGDVYYDGYNSSAQPIPYQDLDPTPLRQVSHTQQKTTPAREIKPNTYQRTPPAPEIIRPGYNSGSDYSTSPENLPSIPPAPLSPEMILHQERGAIDAKIIDVQDKLYPPTSQNIRMNRPIRQVVYEDVQW